MVTFACLRCRNHAMQVKGYRGPISTVHEQVQARGLCLLLILNDHTDQSNLCNKLKM